jgi:putative transposase
MLLVYRYQEFDHIAVGNVNAAGLAKTRLAKSAFCHAKMGPKVIAELGIRSWVCAECGVAHDRDINSAQNILFRSGHRTPAEGISALF